MKRFALLFALLVVAVPVGAHAQITWTGGTSGSWGTASNWSSGTVPGAGDIVELDNGPGSNYTIRIDLNNQSIDSLAITSSNVTLEVTSGFSLTTTGGFRQQTGTVSGSGNVFVNGPLDWSGGRIAGTDPSTDTLRVEGGGEIPSDVTLDGRRLLVPTGETLRWSDGGSFGSGLVGENGAIIEVQSGAQFELASFEPLSTGAGTAPRLLNRGTVEKVSSGQMSIGWEVRNEDSLRVSTSDGGVRVTGTPIGAGGTAGVASGVYEVRESKLEFRVGSSVTFDADSRIRADAPATFDVESTVSPRTDVAIAGTLDVKGTLSSNNRGGDTTRVVVQSGATLTDLAGTALTLNNNGGVIVNTTDPIEIGALTLDVTGGSLFAPSSDVTVQGNATVRGTFTSAHDLTVQGDFNWDDGRIAGTDPSTDTLRVESGGEIPSDVTLDGRRLLVPTGETLRYSDTGSFGSIGFTAENGAILEIQSGARFEATGGEPLNTGAGAAPRIVNRGTLAKPSGSQNTINWDVQNLDSVRVSSSSGGFRIDGSLIGPVGSAGAAEGVFQSSASNLRLNPPSDTIELTRDALLRTTSGGTIEANTNLSGKGSFEIGGDLFAEFPIQMDSSGVELVSGGELIRGTPGSRVSDSVLVLGQGVIEGSGTLDGDVFIDNVRVEPGTDGTAGAMTVDGTYEQSAGTRLDIELGGTTGGTDYDSLSVNGTTLAGELRFDQLNNFTPTTADTLRPVDWGGGGRTGQFDQISGTSSFDGPIRVLYDDTDDTALEVAGKVVPIQAVDPSSLSDTLVFDTTRTQLLQVKNAETDPASDSLKYTLQGQSGASWLSLSQTTGTVGPDIGPNSGTDSVDVTFSTRAGNAPGLYRDTLRVTDQDTDDTTRVPVQLTIERPAITLSTGPQAPSPGTDIAVDIGIPPTLTPKAGTFLYRTAGDETFQTASLDVSGLQDNTAGTLSATVPGSAVTKQGIQYYVQLTSQDTTGSVSINTPAGAPTRPAFVPVEFQEVQAEGSFEPERYRMLAVPVTGLGDRSVFDVLTDQYGEYDPSEWRFSRWVPSQSAYREGADVGPLQPGEAAWLIIKQGDPLTITNGAQSVDASAPRSISLDPGWNQVGNPFPFPVAWADVTRPAPVRPPVGYDGSRPEGERFRFGIDVLPPWNGAFVFNSADTSVTLEVPPEGASTPSAATQGRALTQTKSSEGGYRLQATAHVSAGGTRWTSRPVQVGFASDAEEGIDTKDRLQPPAVRSHVRLQAVPSEGPALARSVKPVPATDASAAQRGGAWNLTLRLGEEGQSAERASLRLSAQEALPESFRRYVVDRDENRRLPLTHETATVPLSEGRSTRRLRVIVGTKAFAQAHSDGAKMAVEKTTLHANAPNPFSESTTIPYQVAEDTHVRIAVYDLLGRRVSVLVNGTREAGVHEFQWQPGERGAALASGTYFCRMTAGGETFTQKLVVVR